LYASIFQITIDCTDARAQATFWSWVTGWAAEEKDATPGHVEYALVPPTPGVPGMYFTTVPEPKTSKNRVHLDLHPAWRPAGGSSPADRAGRPGAAGPAARRGRIVMADPEGNEFCLEPWSRPSPAASR
jgi:glyoxalase superfamily protein